MTKPEALEALQQGQKITHRYFSPEEFIMQPDPSIEEYQFEDEVKVSSALFWIDRQQDFWNDGWDFWKE